MIFLAPAESWSHFFGGGLHENGVKIPGVFGANVPTAHTTDTAFFFGLAWIGFVDRATGQLAAQMPQLSQASLASGLKGTLGNSLYVP